MEKISRCTPPQKTPVRGGGRTPVSTRIDLLTALFFKSTGIRLAVGRLNHAALRGDFYHLSFNGVPLILHRRAQLTAAFDPKAGLRITIEENPWRLVRGISSHKRGSFFSNRGQYYEHVSLRVSLNLPPEAICSLLSRHKVRRGGGYLNSRFGFNASRREISPQSCSRPYQGVRLATNRPELLATYPAAITITTNKSVQRGASFFDLPTQRRRNKSWADYRRSSFRLSLGMQRQAPRTRRGSSYFYGPLERRGRMMAKLITTDTSLRLSCHRCVRSFGYNTQVNDNGESRGWGATASNLSLRLVISRKVCRGGSRGDYLPVQSASRRGYGKTPQKTQAYDQRWVTNPNNVSMRLTAEERNVRGGSYWEYGDNQPVCRRTTWHPRDDNVGVRLSVTHFNRVRGGSCLGPASHQTTISRGRRDQTLPTVNLGLRLALFNRKLPEHVGVRGGYFVFNGTQSERGCRRPQSSNLSQGLRLGLSNYRGVRGGYYRSLRPRSGRHQQREAAEQGLRLAVTNSVVLRGGCRMNIAQHTAAPRRRQVDQQLFSIITAGIRLVN